MADELDPSKAWSRSGDFAESELGSSPCEDALDRVHEWRAEQLERLGIPALSAQIFADLVDWHGIAELVRRGCPPILALRIVA